VSQPEASETHLPNQHLEALRKLLDEHEYNGVLASLKDVLDRLLLGRILTDQRFIPIREFPDIYLADVDDFIDDLLAENGILPLVDRDLKRRIRVLLLRGQARGSHTAVIADATFLNVARSLLQEGREDVRCRVCGYHFRYGDMDDKRRSLLSSLDLRLASSLTPKREVDKIKRPIMTNLEVDHMVPRTGWGPSDARNLQFLCRLCNQGKSIFTSALESLSIISAGSYGLYHGVDRFPNKTIFYSALSYQKSTCQQCGKNAAATELTVVPHGEWFTPWTVDVTCYDCVE
jgi:5-methylcytosine-specific restriction endonuclease McrA